MVSIRRQRLKAIRAGVPVKKANESNSVESLIKLMDGLKKDVFSKRTNPKN